VHCALSLCTQMEVWALYSSEVNHCAVNVCVLAMSADVSQLELQQQRHLLGTAAVIFVVSPSDILSMQVNNILNMSYCDSCFVNKKLSYHKDDRTMRPIYGCPENF